jgi:hypothetical protein
MNQPNRRRKMLTKTKIVFAAALVLGAASAALAGSENTEERGGYVMPGSLVGVNPVYHPDIFGNPAVARSYGFVRSADHTWHVQTNWQQRSHAR